MSQTVIQTKPLPQGTAQLKKIPETPERRAEVWQAALELAGGIPRERPLGRAELLSLGKELLGRLGWEEAYLGYAMVMLNNAFWLAQFSAVPIPRRLLLLPRCLRNLSEVTRCAQERGYRTLVADGSPIVVKIIDDEAMDAILGVGCLDSVEKAFDKVAQVGVPSIAVPLNCAGCKDTEVDMPFLLGFMGLEGSAAAVCTRNYLPLLRVAHRLCAGPESATLIGEASSPEEETARIAADWLRLGGKRLRPFITLAGYKAFHPDGEIPAGVKRAALAIEAFHKASLVHDDIEDDDEARYGQETLHRRYGVPAAINVGDYLLGLGYHLAATAAQDLGPERASLLFRIFSKAHVLLARGQGAELFWRRRRAADLSLAEVLAHYMQKTAPAFEAALASGLVMADAYRAQEDRVRVFASHIGAAFQIKNDLEDWPADSAHVRPTALLALALERCSEHETERLFKPAGPEEIQEIYNRHDVFARAGVLIERFRLHASQAAEGEGLLNFRELLVFLIETVL